MTEVIIFEPVDRIIWLMTVFTLLAIGLLYVGRAKQRKSRNEKLLTLGFSFIFIGLALSRLMIYISSFSIEGSYINNDHIFYGNYSSENFLFLALNDIGYAIWWIFIILYYLFFEMATRRNIYAMTILNVIFLIITIFNSSFFLLLSAIDLVITFYFFVRWSRKSSFEVQADTSMVLMGVILFWLGFFVEIIGVRQENLIISSFPAFLFIFGALMQLSNPIIKQVLFINSTLFMVVILISFSYLSLNQTHFSVFLLGSVLYMLIMTYSGSKAVMGLKAVDLKDFKKGEEEIDDGWDILRMMGKIKKGSLTEAEITLYKEQRICLVCKGRKSGFIYVCPKCEAYYCQKCAGYVIRLDNVCWACESQLDISKPQKKAKHVAKVQTPINIRIPAEVVKEKHIKKQNLISSENNKEKSPIKSNENNIPKAQGPLKIIKKKRAPMLKKTEKRTSTSKVEKQTQAILKTKLCRNCGALNIQAASHCEKCGFNILFPMNQKNDEK